MYCLSCRCRYCAGLLAFQSLDQGKLHVYCPRCIRDAEVAESAVN
jgi:phage FluMu protein Com